MRSEIEKEYLLKAVDAFGKNFFVLSPDFKILAAKSGFKPDKTILTGKICHKFFFNREKPCPCCPVVTIIKTSFPALHHEKQGYIDPNKISCIFAYPILEKGKLESIVVMDFDLPTLGDLEDKLQRPSVFLQKLIVSAPDGVIAADKTGKILFFSESAAKITGHTVEEALTDLDIRDIYPPGGAQDVMWFLRKDGFGPKGKLKSFPVDLLNKNKAKVPIYLDAAIVYEAGCEMATIGFFHDLRDEIKMQDALDKTKLKLLEAEKMASQSRIRAIIESLPTGVAVTDLQGRIILMNPSFRSLLEIEESLETGGYSSDYVEDKELCDFVIKISRHSNEYTGNAAAFELVLSKDKYLMIRGRPVVGEKNEKLGAVVTCVDISNIKVLDRLKSEFLAKVSHELKSPLSTIHQQLALVLGDMAGEAYEEDLKILARAKERTLGLISLIGDLLDLSRIDVGTFFHEPGFTQIDDILQKTVLFLGDMAKSKNQKLTLKLSKRPFPSIIADSLAVESVFGNLITNAINYTGNGGKIRVEADYSDKHVRVSVKDNGIGINKENFDKIFQRFYRIKEKSTRYTSGSGLGLPIVKELLDSMSGDVNVKSTYGKGSTFTVFFPIKNNKPSKEMPGKTKII